MLTPNTPAESEFYEEDEPAEKVVEAFESGEKGLTATRELAAGWERDPVPAALAFHRNRLNYLNRIIEEGWESSHAGVRAAARARVLERDHLAVLLDFLGDIARAKTDVMLSDGTHTRYWSTLCRSGRCGECRLTCKCHGVPCVCPCHRSSTEGVAA